ncbi:MAG: carbamoyltransferase HypF, partial [Chloroflexota bacterium]
ASALLLHDRDIASRYDDSVTRVVAGSPTVVRRARGYAPQPVDLPFRAPHDVLACGAQLKSTFCLLKDRYAFVGQHIGDLENAHTLRHFGDTVALYQRLFNVHPTLVAHDLHPNYPSTTFALALEGVERVAVQHHHAHIVACLAEHGLLGPAIGVAYDGLGYGTDGHFWGGELLLADWRGFRRLGHLREAPMPGAAAAIRKPYRMAVGLLQAWLSGETELFAPFLESIDARELALLRSGLNAPLTSSCGRLFDAVAALLGVCREARYEGQAAMELQALADPAIEGTYPFDMRREPGEQGAATLIIDPAPTLAALYREHRLGEPLPAIAMRFHRSVAEWTATAARIAQEETGLRQVALAGGVFQNTLLLREVLRRLPEAVHPRQLPANDGGISFGQAVVAATRHMEEGACPS